MLASACRRGGGGLLACLTQLALLLALTLAPSPLRGVEALKATWVTLSPVAADARDGVPAGRCDHTFLSLQGASQRANGAVRFPTAQGLPPVVDPWAGQFWLFGGHSTEGLADSWMLDVTDPDAPNWRRINYTVGAGSAGSVGARWSTPVGFVPGGLDANKSDVGLTAVLFGGATGDFVGGYWGDVATLNFASETWRELQATPASITDAAPFPRGYTSWIALPEGFGSGYVAPTGAADSGCFYLLGGLGAPDGVHNGPLDKDWNDEWIFNVTGRTWSRPGLHNCLQNSTACSDATSLAALLTAYTAQSYPAPTPALNLTVPLRPADVSPVYTRLLQAMQSHTGAVAAMMNDPASCKTTCTEFQSSELDANGTLVLLRPPPLEGYRMATVGNKGYLFGGYRCTQNAQIRLGGVDCFVQDMWVLDYASLKWSRVRAPSSAADPQYALWPSRRCYATMVGHESRGLVIVQGGYYLDLTGVGFFYNDAFAFDTNLNQFVPFDVRGVPPQKQWSAAATLQGDDMYLRSATNITTKQPHAQFRHGPCRNVSLQIGADNAVFALLSFFLLFALTVAAVKMRISILS